MTDDQRRTFYFPEWRRAATTLGWTMRRGRMTAGRLPSHGQPFVDELYQKVWDQAEEFAWQSQRAVTDTDLRYALNYVATKRVKSEELNTAQTNRAVALMRLLADPDNIDKVDAWLRPELAEKRGLLVRLGFNRAYAVNIARDQFGTGNLDDLDVGQLRKLVWTVTNRHRAKARKTRDEHVPF